MKNILRDKLGKFKSLKINLLDGQRRGEIVFRRVFLLLVLYAIVVLVLKLTTPKPEEGAEIEKVQAREEVMWEGDQKVEIDENGKKWYIHEEYNNYQPPVEEIEEVVETAGKGVIDDGVRQYIKSYGGKIDDGYLTLLRKYCDEETLKVVVAISVAESSMGKNTSKQSNYFGWFKGNNRSYDPIREEMAQEICRGIGTYYRNIGFDRNLTMRYTGGDRVETWTGNFMSAIESM